MERTESTEHHSMGNYVAFVLSFIAFVGCLYLMGSAFSFEGFTAFSMFGGSLILGSLAFGIPMRSRRD